MTEIQFRYRRFIRLLPLLSLAVVAGCGGGPKIVSVTGTVSRGGQPVPNLFLNFVPNEGRPSWAVTDAQGRYKLNYDKTHDGAVTGIHKVFVSFRPRDPGEEMKVPVELTAILKKYGDEATTPLKYEITTNGQVIDIQLD